MISTVGRQTCILSPSQMCFTHEVLEIQKIIKFVRDKLSILLVLVFLLFLAAALLFQKFKPAPSNGNNALAREEPTTVESLRSGDIVIDISGAVISPGVYTFSQGARVYDAVSKGGGVSNEASLSWVSRSLNLAKKLTDSEKIYIPFEWEIIENNGDFSFQLPSDSETAQTTTSDNQTDSLSSGSKINVNKDTLNDIDTLPGIGAVYASRIVENRPYDNYDDFNTKSGLSKSVVDKIKNLIEF